MKPTIGFLLPRLTPGGDVKSQTPGARSRPRGDRLD